MIGLVVLTVAIQIYLLKKGMIKSLSFYLCIVLLIPYIVKFTIAGFGILYNQLLQLILFVAFMMSWRKRKTPNRKFMLYFIALLCYFIFIIPFTSTPYSLQLQAVLKIILSFTPIFIAFYAFRDSKDVEYIHKWLTLVCLIMVVYGLIVYATGRNFYMEYLINIYGDISNTSSYLHFMDEERAGLSHRISSTIVHPLSYGQILILFLGYYLFMYVPLKNKMWHWLLIVLIIINVFMSGSRSCIFPMALILLVRVSLMEIKTKVVLTIILCLMVVSSPALFSLVTDIYNMINGTIRGSADYGGSNISMRALQFITFIEIISDNSLLGRGNGFVAYQGDKYPDMLGYESIIFNEGSNYGLIGLLFYLILFSSVFRLMKRYNLSKTGIVYVVAISFSYLLSIIMTGIQGSFVFFWILMVAYLNLHKNQVKL